MRRVLASKSSLRLGYTKLIAMLASPPIPAAAAGSPDAPGPPGMAPMPGGAGRAGHRRGEPEGALRVGVGERLGDVGEAAARAERRRCAARRRPRRRGGRARRARRGPPAAARAGPPKSRPEAGSDRRSLASGNWGRSTRHAQRISAGRPSPSQQGPTAALVGLLEAVAVEVLLDLAHLAAQEARREADVARVRRARERAGLRRQDGREAEAEDGDGDEHLEQREPLRRGPRVLIRTPYPGARSASTSSRGRGMLDLPLRTIGLAGERRDEERHDVGVVGRSRRC